VDKLKIQKEGINMEKYDKSTYGDTIAEVYDVWYSKFDENIIDRLFELAPKGSAFELGIGTGRIAIPLMKRGLTVEGIDSSRLMVNRLKRKKSGKDISVQIGDFSNFKSKKKYDLVYIVFNTLFGLTSLEDQINCFKSVYAILKPNGKFVVEAFVPDLNRFDMGQTIRTSDITDDNIIVECAKHDSANQMVVSHLLRFSEKGTKIYPNKLRYAWPFEIELMGRLTGFQLTDRWGDWQKRAFNSSSSFHVSIFNKGTHE
jgi:SAM-dependent methyltransferase